MAVLDLIPQPHPVAHVGCDVGHALPGHVRVHCGVLVLECVAGLRWLRHPFRRRAMLPRCRASGFPRRHRCPWVPWCCEDPHRWSRDLNAHITGRNCAGGGPVHGGASPQPAVPPPLVSYMGSSCRGCEGAWLPFPPPSPPGNPPQSLRGLRLLQHQARRAPDCVLWLQVSATAGSEKVFEIESPGACSTAGSADSGNTSAVRSSFADCFATGSPQASHSLPPSAATRIGILFGSAAGAFVLPTLSNFLLEVLRMFWAVWARRGWTMGKA